MEDLDSIFQDMTDFEASLSPLPEKFGRYRNIKCQVDTAFFMIYDEYMKIVEKLNKQDKENKNLRSNLAKKIILLKRYAKDFPELSKFECKNNKRNNNSRTSEESSDSDDDRLTIVDEDWSMLNAADEYIKWKWAYMENELIKLKRLRYLEKYYLMNIIKNKDFEIMKLRNKLRERSHEFQDELVRVYKKLKKRSTGFICIINKLKAHIRKTTKDRRLIRNLEENL